MRIFFIELFFVEEDSMKKYLFCFNFILIAFNAHAQNSTSPLKVSSTMSNSCSISAQNYNYGILDSATTITQDIKLRCNKDTLVELRALSKNNPEGYRSGFMTQNGQQVPQMGNIDKPLNVGIRYFFYTSLVQSNSDYTVVQRPLSNVLQFKFPNGYDYSMKLKVNTGNEVILPISAQIHSSYNSKVYIPGNYYDTAVFNLSF